MKNETKNINIKSATNIKYGSNVTVKILNKNKVIKSFSKHNTAQFPLFNFLLEALAHNYDSDLCPNFVYVLFSDSDQDNTPKYIGTAQSVIGRAQVSGNKLIYTILVSGNKSYINVNGAIKPYCGVAIYNQNNVNNSHLNDSESTYLTWSGNVKNNASMFIQLDSPVLGNNENNILITWEISLEDSENNKN